MNVSTRPHDGARTSLSGCAAALLLMSGALVGCSPQAGDEATTAAAESTDSANASEAKPAMQTAVAPSFSATTLDGSAFSFPAAAEGKPSVVLMWATWCPYCEAFMPYLDKIQAEYTERGISVVAINAKERGRGDPRAYMRDKGYEFVTVLDGDDIAAQWGVEFLPGLFVVDGAGDIVFSRQWTDLPAGQTVAELWDGQVRSALDAAYRN